MIAQEGQSQIEPAHEDGDGSTGHPDAGNVFLSDAKWIRFMAPRAMMQKAKEARVSTVL